MKRTLALFLALALAPGAFAQDLSRPWTLKECTQWAMDHNISLHQQENSLKQREIELENARNDRLPSLSASASENLSFGRGLTSDNTYANTNTTSTSFSKASASSSPSQTNTISSPHLTQAPSTLSTLLALAVLSP